MTWNENLHDRDRSGRFTTMNRHEARSLDLTELATDEREQALEKLNAGFGPRYVFKDNPEFLYGVSALASAVGTTRVVVGKDHFVKYGDEYTWVPETPSEDRTNHPAYRVLESRYHEAIGFSMMTEKHRKHVTESLRAMPYDLDPHMDTYKADLIGERAVIAAAFGQDVRSEVIARWQELG